MNATIYALLCLAAAAANVATVGEKMKSCNDWSDIICTKGCKTFVTITNCTLPSYPKKPVTTELCTIGYGRDTAAAKACITGQGSFCCTGTTTGHATCSGCVPYNKVSWAN
ncbi:uncharacterized protein PGTG_20495 [Puccinia graminis f. sp. tritici CRL 75-36-700-3]|uniref:Uncharacterized protein n=1 Tax=Puccinia graminis f. sp. tritici (strain CRL 75-36-700-3 / race SCCL) TaxID=418459 RepID=E3NY90_PUCGT|nr:uncharacterized protein PGTG_20495 [Puccinia graminis f. sp. tritici CRL 75-36-700-3]EFP94539.1 hypothetical protein PGTG_20495 [Puccinia graminis f. sp. tritici CRL 75-36-700-3]